MLRADNVFEAIFLVGFVVGSVIRKIYTASDVCGTSAMGDFTRAVVGKLDCWLGVSRDFCSFVSGAGAERGKDDA